MERLGSARDLTRESHFSNDFHRIGTMSSRYLSISQLSELTGKDRRTISKRLDGVKPHSANGRAQLYDAHEVLETLYVSDKVEGMDKKLLRIELALEEERLTKLKLENGKTTGELATIEDVVKTVGKEYSFVRAQLRSLPSRLAKPLSMVSDPNTVHSRLKDAVEECLAELTADEQYEHERELLDSARTQAEAMSPRNAQAIADTEPGSMGRPESVPKPRVK